MTNWLEQAMSSPMFGFGAGLLGGAMQNQPGLGMQAGWQNLMQANRANQATAMLTMRIEEMQRQRRLRENQNKAIQALYGNNPDALRAAQAGQMDLANRLAYPQPKEQEPLSAIAKLQADLNAGRITPQQYDIGLERLKPVPAAVVNVGQQETPPIPKLVDPKIGQKYGFNTPVWRNPKTGEFKTAPKVSVQEAAAVSGIELARSDLNIIKEVFKPGGEWSDQAIGTRFIPRSEGARAEAAMERSLETMLRIKTGAEAKASEVQSLKKQFMPSLGDSDKAKDDKLKAYEAWIEGTARQLGRSGGPSDSGGGGNDLDAAMKKYGITGGGF